MSSIEDAAFVRVPTDECEAIVGDLTTAIDALLDGILVAGVTRTEAVDTLLKVASARYLIRKQLAAHDEKHGSEGTGRDTVSP